MMEMLILTVHLPGSKHSLLGGFILAEEGSEEYAIVFRRYWAHLCEPHDAEVLEGMEGALQAAAAGMFKEEFLSDLECRFSNTIRCVERMALPHGIPLEEQRTLLERALIVPTLSEHCQG